MNLADERSAADARRRADQLLEKTKKKETERLSARDTARDVELKKSAHLRGLRLARDAALKEEEAVKLAAKRAKSGR
jgi:hypothetical protein